MTHKVVTFKCPAGTNEFSLDYLFKPVCKTAKFLTLLAGRECLSNRELYVIEKIGLELGFQVKIIEEKHT